MKNQGSYIAKMSEVNILNEYSRYLQQAAVTFDKESLREIQYSEKLLLSYAEFKDYYINGLIGKDNYLDELVLDLQFTGSQN